ncbi:hypothetical protein BD780_001652 [Clostridium tetanomorphum]|uniref:Uncharacterized protein n=1 Tax=Clostridium tetanomorphum TaxID=1553 RepID=A0A923E8L8_CLOTT|nr:hypothetical protein [Clostridium tetanomorphum]KAJ49250.1 hypothetical protein CTM_24151 [Clostridium tetanomorphum DSM 665]KAJ52726.1 hypothetical protein CTM_07061 [Clostridium tetanomorphum DSM 665]MBC2396721.1 hypothetical protein [Clostridium tetanomorphum]MBP1863319.1 hypothetical protein [Clostridium tetanomorphum]NRS84427.1 hypothetical protein [Clostridium tetanomorphum]
MKKIDEAIDRIRILECPTGDLENRVAEILEGYGVANKSKVNINRDKHFDRDESQAYRIQIPGEKQSIVVLAKSGYDDYVAKVVDVYSKL